MPRDASGGRFKSVAQFAQALDEISGVHRRDENLLQFMEAAYCALAKRTAFDEARAAALEARYMAVVGHYEADKQGVMSRMSTLLGRLMLTLPDYEGDFLRDAYMSDELALLSRGQAFTPYCLVRAMAKMLITREEVNGIIARGGPVTVMDPACGTGNMVAAFAEEIRELEFDPAQVMLATLVDVDALCVKMAFLQMWAKNIPAICIQGNSLTLTEVERAVTPAALLQRWPAKVMDNTVREGGNEPGGTPQPETPTEAPTVIVEPLECTESTRRPASLRSAVFEQADLFGPDE